ncbi:MAG: mechanosensitive ion channel, partial [Anaerolineae bacterium]|nr:mechanosensitive ion channel [Anaerolineae bacterium]
PRCTERQLTLQALIASAISSLAIIVATLLSLSLFVSLDSLIWVVGLFSAAFGLGARPFISDYLTGITFIFEDTFDVGDKIEIPTAPRAVEGVVEVVSLRTTRIRGMDGELYTIPNGDIRLMRNFSRGSFSMTTVKFSIPAPELKQTLTLLDNLKDEAMTLLPNLLEPWQIISESGVLGEQAELTIFAKARFGKGAELRTNLLALVQERLSDAAVEPNAGLGE